MALKGQRQYHLDMLEMQILRPQPRPPEKEVGGEPSICVLRCSLDAHQSLKITALVATCHFTDRSANWRLSAYLLSHPGLEE